MVRVVTPSKRATPCWRWTTKLPASRSSKKPSAARARGRARRCGTRRPVTSVSESTATLASGRMNPLVSGAATTHTPGVPGAARDHRRVHSLRGQCRGEPPRPRRRGGAEGDGVALSDQPRHSGRQSGGVSRHGVEAPHRQRGHVGALGDGRQRGDAGWALAEEAFEGHVQAREALVLRLLRSPGGRQRLGQRGLLVEELDPAVPDAARLDQDDLRPGGQQIGQDPRRVVEEREPRLHAVELRALGQALPHRRPPGPACHQLGPPRAAPG